MVIVLLRRRARRVPNIAYQRIHPIRLFAQNQRLLARKFRMGEVHLRRLCNLVAPLMNDNFTPNWSVDLENKVIIALRYLATDAHEKVLADTIGLSQKTVSNAVAEVVKALNHPMIVKKFIKNQRVLHCRKGYTALNVPAVVNARGRFIYVNSNFPGSVHDSSVYAYSRLKEAFDAGRVVPGYCFVGDSGFANGNDIITPIRNPSTRQEEYYNKWHRKMRVIVECAFGKWKKRFAILEEGIRLEPKRAAQVVMACAVLHNMMMDMGCLRQRELGNRVAVCRHPPRSCSDIRTVGGHCQMGVSFERRPHLALSTIRDYRFSNDLLQCSIIESYLLI
ncbi:hypothetical protein ANCDUO_03429 [Ancylostoma duodenale]|uniref:DDE Tnp4 domain-containing protein n=1 Tax=Ancylostoma duodenale TaxID=51022 RepID=A0A0C2H9Q1_9BILA|nr:hypothetical protein ANCDUO_03429 [Ancylostoma duodenale]